MAYDEELAQRVRVQLADQAVLEEKKMMGGLTFMVNGKMCVGIIKDELMCRVNPALHDECVAKEGVRTMIFTKRPMSGFIQVEPRALATAKQLRSWIDIALSYNAEAKASKKPSKTKKVTTNLSAKQSKETKATKSGAKKLSTSSKSLKTSKTSTRKA